MTRHVWPTRRCQPPCSSSLLTLHPASGGRGVIAWKSKKWQRGDETAWQTLYATFRLKTHDSPLFLLLRTQYGHAFQIPREANQRPFTGNLLQAAQGELVKAQYGFDDAEHGFDGLRAQGIERPASFCFGSVFETRWS